MDYKTLIYAKSDKVATITLNRPEKRNAIDEIMGEELVACLNRCNEDIDTKAVILAGQGKVFCAGGDLSVRECEVGSELLRIKRLLNAVVPVISELRRMKAPVIAAVNGPAVGGGFALALACDLIIAAESASFSSHYVKVGIAPDLGLTYMLPRMVGLKRATWLMFTGEVVDAQKGYEMGFINRVAKDSELLNEANAIAKRLAVSASLAIARTKALINLSLHESLDSQMENEKHAVARSVLTEDCREAVIAFRDKREPKFKGR